MTECRLDNDLNYRNHGCYIPDNLLAENRLTPEKKVEIEKTGGVMPWLVGKMSMHQVEFLAAEFGRDKESV
jgi:hypothetical protein